MPYLKRSILCLYFMLASGAIAQSGPSFDCTQASTATEGVICAIPELGALDQRLASTYSAVKSRSTASEADTLLRSQRAWLRERDRCGPSVSCLENSMRSRILELQAFKLSDGTKLSEQVAPASLDKQQIMAVQGLIAAPGSPGTAFVPDGVIGPNTLAGAAKLMSVLQLSKSGQGDIADLYRWMTSQGENFGEFTGEVTCQNVTKPIRLWSVKWPGPIANSNAFVLIDDMAFLAHVRLPKGQRSEIVIHRVYPDIAPNNTAFRGRGTVSEDGDTVHFTRISGGLKRQRCSELTLTRAASNAPLEPATGTENPIVNAPQETPKTLIAQDQDLDSQIPLTVEALGGNWRHVRFALAGNIFEANMKYFLLPKPVVIQPLNQTTANIQFDPKNAPLSYLDLGLEGFAFNLRPNTRGSTGGYVFGRLIPKSFRSGVDILSDQNRQLLIRFRRTEGARTLGIASLDFDAFCNGPAAALSSAAPTELKVIERIQKGYPDLNMNTRRGLALGLFGGKVFSETFGVDFTELDNGVRTEIFERLRACALYHPNRSVGQTLVNMLWGDEYAIDWHAADTYVAKHGRYRGRAVNYEVKTLPGVIATALSASAEAHAIIATAREDLASVEDDLAALEAKANSIRDAALSLPPSEAEDALILASGTFRSIARQKEEQRLAQLDKTLPAQPETTLIREAAQAYVLKNCNRNSVLLRYFLSGGDSAAALVSIKSAKPNGTSCEVNAGVQLYALNVSSVTSANCSEGDPATCTFTARVSCRSRINPEFGFETNLANIDPVCPVVQLPQYTLQGEFRRNSPSRWTATAVE